MSESISWNRQGNLWTEWRGTGVKQARVSEWKGCFFPDWRLVASTQDGRSDGKATTCRKDEVVQLFVRPCPPAPPYKQREGGTECCPPWKTPFQVGSNLNVPSEAVIWMSCCGLTNCRFSWCFCQWPRARFSRPKR